MLTGLPRLAGGGSADGFKRSDSRRGRSFTKPSAAQKSADEIRVGRGSGDVVRAKVDMVGVMWAWCLRKGGAGVFWRGLWGGRAGDLVVLGTGK